VFEMGFKGRASLSSKRDGIQILAKCIHFHLNILMLASWVTGPKQQDEWSTSSLFWNCISSRILCLRLRDCFL